MIHTLINRSISPSFLPSSLLIVTCSACLLLTGCQSGPKAETSVLAIEPLPQYVSPAELSAPSVGGLLLGEAVVDEKSDDWSAEQWVDIATSLYQEQHYARALRAANIALDIDEALLPARQIALLATIKIMQNNSHAFQKNKAMSDDDKADLKESLTVMTSLINTQKVALTD